MSNYKYKAVVIHVLNPSVFDINIDLGFDIVSPQRIQIKDFEGPCTDGSKAEKERAKLARKRAAELLLDKTVEIQSFKNPDNNERYLVDLYIDGVDYKEIMKKEDLARF